MNAHTLEPATGARLQNAWIDIVEAANHNRYVTVHAYHSRSVNQALRAGVNLVYRTDLFGALQARQLDEFTIRTRVLPNIDVIRSAISTTARLLGMEGKVGILTPGAYVDLLVIDGDTESDLATQPSRSIAASRSPTSTPAPRTGSPTASAHELGITGSRRCREQ